MAPRKPSVARALATALKSAPIAPADAAAVALAKVYAGALDDADDSEDLARAGRLLLPVLNALGMTPSARGAITKGASSEDAPVTSRLDELRARRRSRADRAATVDASAP